MKYLILASLALLAACGDPLATPAPAPEAPAPVAADAMDVSQAAVMPLDQFIVGRWGDSGDCKKDIVFDADGTFRSYTGGSGNWSLSGDTISMTGAGGTFTLRLRQIDQATLETTSPDGAVVLSQRC